MRPHAPSSITATSGPSSGQTRAYAYDDNGNAVSASAGAWRAINYTSFNLPTSAQGAPAAGGTSGPQYLWAYDENHQRVRETRSSGQGGRVTWYLHPDNQGGLGFEAEENGTSTPINRHYLNAGGQMLVLVTRQSFGSYAGPTQTAPPTLTSLSLVKLEYWHKDHLGSLIATSDHTGSLTARYAYDPYGKRRQTSGQYDEAGNLVIDWVDGASAGTDRGYTGHEHLDDIGLIHMNGRVFDAHTGRFLQADPFIQFADELQSYNRYAYCFGNPLNCTDPSGLISLSRLFAQIVNGITKLAYDLSFAKYLGVRYQDYRVMASIAIGVLIGPGGSFLQVGNVYAQAAIAGFASGAVATGSLQGAMQGAFSAVVFAGVGQYLKGAEFASRASEYATGVALHGVAGCVTAVAGGGKCGPGALSAAFTKAVSSSGLMDGINKAAEEGDWGARTQGTLIAAVVGGTGSVLGGGKFANGAQTGAFSYLFNQIAEKEWTRPKGLSREESRTAEGRAAALVPGFTFLECAIEGCGWVDWTLAGVEVVPVGGKGAAFVVQFGRIESQAWHAFRHVEAQGFSRDVVSNAITMDLAQVASTLSLGRYNGSVLVNGIKLDYTAYKFADGAINVGRITPPRKP